MDTTSIYKPADAAQFLHISPNYLNQLSREGKITASSLTPGGHRRYTEQDLIAARKYLSPDRDKTPVRPTGHEIVLLLKVLTGNRESISFDKINASFSQDTIACVRGEIANEKAQVDEKLSSLIIELEKRVELKSVLARQEDGPLLTVSSFFGFYAELYLLITVMASLPTMMLTGLTMNKFLDSDTPASFKALALIIACLIPLIGWTVSAILKERKICNQLNRLRLQASRQHDLQSISAYLSFLTDKDLASETQNQFLTADKEAVNDIKEIWKMRAKTKYLQEHLDLLV